MRVCRICASVSRVACQNEVPCLTGEMRERRCNGGLVLYLNTDSVVGEGRKWFPSKSELTYDTDFLVNRVLIVDRYYGYRLQIVFNAHELALLENAFDDGGVSS